MTEVIHLVLTLAFLAVWLMVGSDLVSRHSREARLRATPELSAIRSRRR